MQPIFHLNQDSLTMNISSGSKYQVESSVLTQLYYSSGRSFLAIIIGPFHEILPFFLCLFFLYVFQVNVLKYSFNSHFLSS